MASIADDISVWIQRQLGQSGELRTARESDPAMRGCDHVGAYVRPGPGWEGQPLTPPRSENPALGGPLAVAGLASPSARLSGAFPFRAYKRPPDGRAGPRLRECLLRGKAGGVRVVGGRLCSAGASTGCGVFRGAGARGGTTALSRPDNKREHDDFVAITNRRPDCR